MEKHTTRKELSFKRLRQRHTWTSIRNVGGKSCFRHRPWLRGWNAMFCGGKKKVSSFTDFPSPPQTSQPPPNLHRPPPNRPQIFPPNPPDLLQPTVACQISSRIRKTNLRRKPVHCFETFSRANKNVDSTPIWSFCQRNLEGACCLLSMLAGQTEDFL